MEKPTGIDQLLNYVQIGDLAEVKKLLAQQAVDVNATDSVGDTALHQAAGKGKRDIVRFLVEKGANVNAKNGSGSTPLHKVYFIKFTLIFSWAFAACFFMCMVNCSN